MGGGGGSGQDGCERRIKVFVKIKKKMYIFFFLGGGVWSGGGGVRVDVNREVKFFAKIKKKIVGGGSDWGGGQGGCIEELKFLWGGSGWGFRVDVNEELKFL